jgi:dolichyl-phosphate beta-glucosyltransferase
MPNEKIHLSIIIPAYNEKKRLPKTLKEINNYLKNQFYLSEIIVVSDGSTDGTTKIVRDLVGEIKNLKLIEFKVRQGKGFGVKTGILEAKGKYRIFTDADNSTSIDQIEKMWPYLKEGYDVVIGSRDIKGAVLAVPQPLIRKIVLGEGFKLLRKIIIGLWEIQDTQCGFKCFTEKAAEEIFPKLTIDRFGFDPEALVIAEKLGYKIKEIPIVWINDAASKVKFKNIIEMFLETIKIRLNLISGKYSEKEEIEKPLFRKTDILSALIIGEFSAWLFLVISENIRLTFNYWWLFPIILPILALFGLWFSFWLGKKILVIFQAAKFALVGILNTLIDLGLLNFLIFISGINKGLGYSIFKGISFTVAVINSYFWNKFWTFRKSKTAQTGKEFMQFLIVSLIGFGFNVGIASLVVNIIGVQFGLSKEIWANIGAISATTFAMLWNFVGYKFIVFK